LILDIFIKRLVVSIICDMDIRFYRIRSTNLEELPSPGSTLDGITASLPPGVYTTFSTLAHGTKVLGLSQHLQRLYIPSVAKPSVNESELRERISQVAKINLPKEARVRLVLVKETGEMYIAIQPFTPLSRSFYENGVHVITSDMERQDPRIKGTDFIIQSLEQRKQIAGDVFEILLTKRGGILEGMTSNFYAVKHPNIIVTAGNGILEGVTRNTLLQIAKEQGLPVEYRSPEIGENFTEAFLTSSSRGVVPIIRIDESTIGDGRPGGITMQLSAGYESYVQEKAELIY